LAHHWKFGGLGRTIAEAALAAGDQVLATAREPARLEDLVHRFGSRIHTVQQDVRNGSAAATAVQIAVDVFGRIDVVVNAARSADPTVEDFSIETFSVPMDTNLFGFAYLIDATLPILCQQRSGHIIEIPPQGSRIPPLGLSGYHISKDAVEDFTFDLAHKVAPLGIKVTIVETGCTRNTSWILVRSPTSTQ
jgi:NADP-dependent 3-hydroxy acid dehydrogenase YdfG